MGGGTDSSNNGKHHVRSQMTEDINQEVTGFSSPCRLNTKYGWQNAIRPKPVPTPERGNKSLNGMVELIPLQYQLPAQPVQLLQLSSGSQP